MTKKAATVQIDLGYDGNRIDLIRSRPNGSRTQRPKRHLAESRQAAFSRLRRARTQAVDVIRFKGLLDWAKEWGIGKIVRVVAWKIERDTYHVNINRLESMKMGVDAWLRIMKAL